MKTLARRTAQCAVCDGIGFGDGETQAGREVCWACSGTGGGPRAAINPTHYLSRSGRMADDFGQRLREVAQDCDGYADSIRARANDRRMDLRERHALHVRANLHAAKAIAFREAADALHEVLQKPRRLDPAHALQGPHRAV